MFVRAMQSASHPILAQIVPIRRCNLDCAYCNEYDKTSMPVPLDANNSKEMKDADRFTRILGRTKAERFRRSSHS